ncbi:MAG: N-glycosylase/DNA lyase [Candidatus Fervidibacter sp.]|uniref:N-glycosylase/DNA lyase n=1 Tax=Candidatus Fervidibacter sp. TaxID=3100871 RepID=UPI0040498E26
MEVFKVDKATLSSIDDLRAYHAKIRPLILRRLEEFMEVWEKGDEAIFEELIFCILTAGASALMGLRGVEALRSVVCTATAEEIAQRINFHLYPSARAQYIVAAREIVQNEMNGKLKAWIESWQGRETRRDACVQKFKGIGYKEASHFLRNVGFRGYAILDKHILRSLHSLGVIDSDKPPSTRNRYLTTEQRYLAFAEQVGIDPDELDLTLWASRTGAIVK